MKYLKFQLMAALLCLTAIVQAQSNVLRVDPVETPAGKTLILPVVMENQSDVTGVQFDIRVPYQLTVGDDNKVVVNLSKTRVNGHTLVTRSMGQSGSVYRNGQYIYYYKYRIILYSDNNALFLDNEGTLLTLQLTTDGELPDGTELPVYLENVTLSNPQMQNVLTNTENGTITIKEIPRPDLTPSDVTFTGTATGPGQTLDVAWKVKNIGKADTEGGWTEEISLVNGKITKLLATTHYDGTIAQNSEVSRNVQLTLPSLLGIDGIAQVQVNIVPDANAGEHQTLRDNNTAKSANNLSVSKHLTLEVTPQRINESQYWQRITLKLSRSGKWNELQAFKVTATNSKGEASTETRLSLPQLITIQPGEASALVYMTMANNTVLDDDSLIHFKVVDTEEVSAYAPVEADLIIEDDELPEITLTASKSDIAEGETFTLTATLQRVSSTDVTVALNSENTKRFSYPQTIVIPAGQTQGTFEVKAVDDDLANGTLTNKFTASAANFTKGEVLVMLSDNDLPVLELTLTPTTVQESDGPVCVAGVLKRLSNIDKKVTVKLTDDANGGLYFGNRTLTLDKGVETVHLNFGPVDNQDKDGDRTYTITAAVWLSSCSCSAAGEAAGHVSAQLTVLDNDGEALRLTSAAGTVKEGGETQLTITRNDSPTADLAVTLTSDYDSDLEYEHNVVIPAGQQSVSVTVKSKTNAVADDSHTVVFTVTSNGYAKGTCWLMITDQTLPDAVFKGITVTPETVVTGDPVELTMEIGNEGNNADLPAATEVKVFEKGITEALATFVIDTPLPVGQTKTLTKTITLPKTVGKHQLYAVINQENTVKELSSTNNTSATVSVDVESPFGATLQTDKTKYNQNNVVVFTGQLTGRDIADAQVDLYVIIDGLREVQKVTADGQGQFEYRWLLNNSMSGHAIAGVCYPDADETTELTSFDIYGLRRTSTGYIKFQPTVGEPIESAIELENPGTLPLTGAKVEVLSKPESYDVEFNLDQTLAAGSKPLITYTMTANAPATGSEWDQIKLNVTTNEGAELPITIYTFARMAEANLKTPNQRITTTMTKGQTREYPIQLINNGQGHTGKVTLALPDWISCAQGSTLAGINKGDTVTLTLLFKPTADMQLNVPVTGTIGFNVEYGNGTCANFSVTPVSDQTGKLVVEVADEYTYYTEEKPRVKGAEVILRNSVTNAIVMIDGQEAKGITGDDGLVTFDNLPEGYYKLSVTANNHDTYSNNIVVDPGTTTKKTVNLSVQAIKVTWSVEETEVEDVYDIVTTVTYETNVPAPVVDLVVPNRLPLDDLAEGESMMFYAIATNKGLINAENSEITLPERTGNYVWEPLGENTGLTIAPQQSYILPVKVTRQTPAAGSRSRESRGGGDSGCTTVTGVYYEWECGLDHKWNKVEKPISYSVCPGKPGGGTPGGGGPGGGGGLGGPGGGGGGGYTASSTTTHVTSNNDCNPCLDALGRWVVNCVQNFIPVWGCTKGVYDCATSTDGAVSRGIDCALTTVSCSAEVCAAVATGTIVGAPAGVVCEIVGWVASGLSCYKSFWKASERCWESYFHDKDQANQGSGSRRKKDASYGVSVLPNFDSNFSYVNKLAAAVTVCEKDLQAYYDYLTEVMGDTMWVAKTKMSEVENLLAIVSTYPDEDLTVDKLRAYKPEGITDELLAKFAERVNNTRMFDEAGVENENRIHSDVLADAVERMKASEQMAVDAGYKDIEEMWDDAISVAYKNLTEQKGSVCSSITLQIKQTMTMTRQAFRGTLTVFNGHETEAMTDMKLKLVVSDHNNNVATAHEFQINCESLKDGLTGELTLDGGWSLAPGKEGTATILFIPTKYAAPTEPEEYSFGGELSYVDPYSGLEVTRELYPVTMTVKPSPELDLTYFMQRDVYGDDPLTLDIVEPMEDAEFALLINNKGYGDATNVKMVTQQPEITENEKGLAIEFQIVSSQVNGGPAALSFGQTIANDLGNIPAHSQIYAQWWLQSTLLGHFTSYNVQATHVTSYGNEDLSLLDQVTIHELIHGFTPPGASAPKRAFLVNDVEDAFDQPDQIYFTDATQKDVLSAQSATATKKSGAVYELTVLPKQAGWTYTNLLDPTAGRQKLLKVVRKSDNLELPLDNVWQTNRSLRDGQEWTYEHRLHVVGEMASSGETYELTYEERPDVELEVEISEPVYDTEFAQQHLVTEDVDVVTVTFSKSIKPETFTAEDITLGVQGEKQNLATMTITPQEDNQTFKLDLSALNATLPNGYYVLTVQTSDVTATDGYNGLVGKKVDWVLCRGGLVNVNTAVFPLNSGEVAMVPLDDMAAPNGSRSLWKAPAANEGASYGKRYRLTATPEAGYEFVNWTMGEEVVSTDEVYDLIANGDVDIVANFKKKQFRVEMTTDDQGTLRGSGTGLYDYQTELEVEAVPQEDFILKGWEIDGELQESTANPLTLTVTKATSVKALFVRDIYNQTLTLSPGWNWVSTYLSEQQSLGDMSRYANRLLSQENELFRDPELGLVGNIEAIMPGQAYKLDASQRFSRTMRGHLNNSPVSMQKGWNWMAYTYNTQRGLEVIQNPSEGDYIVSQQGFSQYADNTWEGTVSQLLPGEGYLYKSATEKQMALNYETAPAGARAASRMALTTGASEENPELMRIMHLYPNTMNVTARIYRDGMELSGVDYNVYAFAGNELRGMSRFVGSNHYLTVYGDQPVTITFVVEAAETGDSYVVGETLRFAEGVVGSRTSPFAFTVGGSTGIDQRVDTSRPMTVYSLEGVLVSRDATLKTLRNLPKGVYIVNGHKCFVK